jgi:hypothetical protein
MNHPFRFSLVVAVLTVCACQKKAEAPASVASSPAPAPVSAPAAVAKTDTTATPAGSPTPSATTRATAPAGELAIIAKARSFAGPEAALDSLRSVHFTGTVTTSDPTDPKKLTHATVDLIFQKPDQQRVMAVSDKTIETTALDGYEAWTRTALREDPTKWQQTLLGSDGVKHLRATVWETLAFYRGLERTGGSVQDLGPATADGVACEKIAFIHGPNIVFYRYIDPKTGRLVLTENEAGSITKDEGDIRANGIHFAKTITTVVKRPDGRSQTITMDFDKVTVNEPFPDSYFAVPSLQAR